MKKRVFTRPLSLQIGDDLRTRLDCSARQLRLTRAALVRTAVQIYLDNRQDHVTAMVAAERRERATEQAAVTADIERHLAVIADNRTALAATIKEHLALTTAERKQRALDLSAISTAIQEHLALIAADRKQRALDRDAMARQHDGIDRVAEDQQLLIAMLNELALFQFAIAPEVHDLAVAAVLCSRRHADWLTKLRDVMVATQRQPSAVTHQFSSPPVATAGNEPPETINQVILQGRLDLPVTLRRTPAGDPVANYRLKTDDGEIHQISAFGLFGTKAARDFAPDDLIYVEAEFRTRDFQTVEDKTKGRKHTVRELCVTKQQLVDKAPTPAIASEPDSSASLAPTRQAPS